MDVEACCAVAIKSFLTCAGKPANDILASGVRVTVMRAVVHALVDISTCFAVAMIPFITGASVAADVICARGISVARLVLALVYICAHDTVARVALIASAFVVFDP